MAFILLCSTASSSALAISTLKETERLWQQNKNRLGYVEYQDEFLKYNNSLKLDTKDGCYDLNGGKVVMYLIIAKEAVIDSVRTNIENPKAQCFKRTYTSLPVKAPPFSPLVIKMVMQPSRKTQTK